MLRALRVLRFLGVLRVLSSLRALGFLRVLRRPSLPQYGQTWSRIRATRVENVEVVLSGPSDAPGISKTQLVTGCQSGSPNEFRTTTNEKRRGRVRRGDL